MSSLDFSDILQARQHFRGIVRQTPFDRSAALIDQTNQDYRLLRQIIADFSGITT
jgi:hypothetical protein